MNGVNTRVSVVVLTHNRTFEVMRTVERLSRLPEHPPLIVVDNASEVNVGALICRRFPSVQVLRLPRNIGAAARNVGAQAAVTPHVAFCDDDMVWAPGSLACGARLLDLHPGVAVVAARVVIGTEGREDERCRTLGASPLPSHGLPGRAIVDFPAGACMVRRHAFLQAGGYDERLFLGAEEQLLALDLLVRGWSLLYSERMTVHHYPSSLRDAFRYRRLLARNRLWTAWLRRSPAAALRTTYEAIVAAVRDRAAREGLVEALRGIPWVLKHRRPVPLRIEEMCVQVERRMAACPPEMPVVLHRRGAAPDARSGGRRSFLAGE